MDSSASRGPGVRPGINTSILIGAATNPYAGRTDAIVTGRQLFTGMNCSGCHSGYAGGGMGPNLRDSIWIYGSTDADLFATIAEGRPNGMPAWGERLPKQQIWQIIAYLRTLGSDAEPVKPPTPTRTTVSHNSADKRGLTTMESSPSFLRTYGFVAGREAWLGWILLGIAAWWWCSW